MTWKSQTPRTSGREPAEERRWWLDESALPQLIWAELMLGQDGVIVRDADGKLHIFERIDEAEAWLREDEYSTLRELRDEGAVPEGLRPPDNPTN